MKNNYNWPVTLSRHEQLMLALGEIWCHDVRTLVEAHLLQVTYDVFIASVYMSEQDSRKVTNRDVHQLE